MRCYILFSTGVMFRNSESKRALICCGEWPVLSGFFFAGEEHIVLLDIPCSVYLKLVLPQLAILWLRWWRECFLLEHCLLSCCTHLETVAWSNRFISLRTSGFHLSSHSSGWTETNAYHHYNIIPEIMDSYRSYWNSKMQSTTWMEGEDKDVYEVESRIPLPRPFPLCSTLNEKNAVVVQTQISHVNHRTNGHLLKVISKISLPTPPYTVSSNIMRYILRRLWIIKLLLFNISFLSLCKFNV